MLAAAPGERLIDARNRTMLCVAYDALLRRSELTALDLADFMVGMPGSSTLLERRTKNDQEGAGHTQFLAPDTVAMVADWVRHSKIQDGALFRAFNKGGRVGGRLGPTQVPRIFKSMARKADLPLSAAASISGHSARVGAPQDLAAQLARLQGASDSRQGSPSLLRSHESNQLSWCQWSESGSIAPKEACPTTQPSMLLS